MKKKEVCRLLKRLNFPPGCEMDLSFRLDFLPALVLFAFPVTKQNVEEFWSKIFFAMDFWIISFRIPYLELNFCLINVQDSA